MEDSPLGEPATGGKREECLVNAGTCTLAIYTNVGAWGSNIPLAVGAWCSNILLEGLARLTRFSAKKNVKKGHHTKAYMYH